MPDLKSVSIKCEKHKQGFAHVGMHTMCMLKTVADSEKFCPKTVRLLLLKLLIFICQIHLKCGLYSFISHILVKFQSNFSQILANVTADCFKSRLRLLLLKLLIFICQIHLKCGLYSFISHILATFQSNFSQILANVTADCFKSRFYWREYFNAVA